MAVNSYFTNFSFAAEQNLMEDLVIESIKIHGIDVKYMPRTLVNKDDLYGEDVLSKFENAYDVEMYIKNVEGFEGEGDLLSRFGLEIRDSMTLTVAKSRFETEVTGQVRPNEGDLIYFPLNDKLFEIKFVEHEAVFYQHGKLYIYDLRVELFDYSSEIISTGNTEIDGIQSEYSLDTLNYELIIEGGADSLLAEDGGVILQEYRIESTDRSANNEFFQQNSTNILDFSEINPFSETDRY